VGDVEAARAKLEIDGLSVDDDVVTELAPPNQSRVSAGRASAETFDVDDDLLLAGR
jgi:hypothetical protein